MGQRIKSAASTAPILPGAWLGVLGGGQLGRMFCYAAQRLGYQVAVLDPDPKSPAGQVAHRHICADYDNEQALVRLATLCQAVTTEFENVPASALHTLAGLTRVAPAAQAVALTQDRATEKKFLQQAGVKVAPFIEVGSRHDLQQARPELFPGILKTARFGYDGKGQIRVANLQQAQQAFENLGQVSCVLEAQLNLADEISVVLARSECGQVQSFQPAHNSHRDGILAVSRVDGKELDIHKIAQQKAEQIAQAAQYVGVLCVEFFVLGDGRLIANEMAPRPHNSGHHTIEACLSSQFEQQVRTMTGLPLGSPQLIQPAVMVNILGDCWFAGENTTENNKKTLHTKQNQQSSVTVPNWPTALAVPGVYLHLYGKSEPRIGRKMGHFTAIGKTLAQAEQRASQAAMALGILY